MHTNDVRPENIRLQPSRVYGRIEKGSITQHPVDRKIEQVTLADIETEVARTLRQREASLMKSMLATIANKLNKE
ncbi:MAG: hypothetical protein ACLP4V_23970 [Methylocella sp.]